MTEPVVINVEATPDPPEQTVTNDSTVAFTLGQMVERMSHIESIAEEALVVARSVEERMVTPIEAIHIAEVVASKIFLMIAGGVPAGTNIPYQNSRW